MKFTRIPEEAFKTLQLNAGILLSSFDPKTAAVTDSALIGATTGGINFAATPSYTDFGEDVDNCPANMKELKKQTGWDIKMSGTYVTVTAAGVRGLIGAADIDSSDETHIVPRNDLKDEDFKDLWWVGDYSDQNDETSGGFLAIHMMDALSTGGFQIKSANRAKGQFAFEYTAHYSMEDQTRVPFEVYLKAGGAA